MNPVLKWNLKWNLKQELKWNLVLDASNKDMLDHSVLSQDSSDTSREWSVG